MRTCKNAALAWSTCCLLLLADAAAAQNQAPLRFSPPQAKGGVVIGTAALNGVYFHVGQAICASLKADGWKASCQAPATAGSVANLQRLRQGGFSFALVQADVAGAALKGWDALGDSRPFEALRSVFSLHDETWTIAVKADSPHANLEALRGKPVSIGAAGSGDQVTSQFALLALGWTPADLDLARPVTPVLQAKALCQGETQAVFRVADHPNNGVAEMANLCPIRLLALSERELDRLIYAAPYYHRTQIAGGLYPGLPQSTAALGVRATLLTVAEVPEDTVHALVKAVISQLEGFKARHPALARLSAKDMLEQGNPAPLHPGALRYYREQGLR